jgi:multiple sugar transport system ATP-binding protein
MAVVTLDRICKRYDGADELAVDEVSFTAAHGEFLVLLGPSGCGKSTTLRMVAGLEGISSGTLRIDEQEMNAVPAKDRDIAMVFQSYALYPHMTVRDNLAFGLRRRGTAKDEIGHRVDDVARMLGLTELLARKPFALSGGQRQRVALGRAIVRDPKVFLFDEPLSNLDAGLRVSTRNELIQLHQRLGATMLYVTHDQVEAMTMGQRICIMNHGRMVQLGPPLEVYGNPADTFVARFLGNPPMNLLDTELDLADGAVTARIGAATVALPDWDANTLQTRSDRRIVFGIRPEDIHDRVSGLEGRPGAPLRCNVKTVEALGAETLLTLNAEGLPQDLIARVGRDNRARVGDTVEVQLDVAATHAFDPETTHALPVHAG